jgi:hypothetical protein
MPFAARFVQKGSITDLHYLEIEPLTAYYPLNSELLHALGIAAFDRDIVSPFVNLGFVVLALLAGWCIGRPWGVAPLSLLGTSLALAVPGLWGINAGQAGSDITGVAFFLSAAAIVANTRGKGPAGLALAAAAAGLAVGAKLSLLAPVAALTLGVIWLALAGRRLRHIGVWFGAMTVTGGFWYARNVVHTGNPLPWLELKLGPLSWDAPPRRLTEDYEYSLAHYATDTAIWESHVRPWFDWAFGGVWFLVIALAAAGVVGALVVGGDRVRRGLGAVALLCAIAYLVTPNSAAGREGDPWAIGLNARYAVPGLALGLALLPAWIGRGERRRAALAVVFAGVLIATLLADTGVWPDRRDDALAIAGGAGAAAAAIAWSRTRPHRPALAAAVPVLLALALLAAGFPVAREYLDDRYRAELATPAMSWVRDVHDARIAVLGASVHYPYYGADLSNELVFIGREGDHGAFTRLTSCREWRAALNAGDFDYVIVAPVTSLNLPAEIPTEAPPELAWTSDDRATSAVFRESLRGAFRIDGRLSPERC